MRVDLNCDLGEGEKKAKTLSLLRIITSANVACGGHAGTAESMEFCVKSAKALSVRLGAHPGLPDAFGRGAALIDPGRLRLLLAHQVSALELIARTAGSYLHHIKLHGSLYHAVEQRQDLADTFLGSVAEWWPSAKVYAMSQGRVAVSAKRFSVKCWAEHFADRTYLSASVLTPRGNPGSLISCPASVRSALEMRFPRVGQGRRPGSLRSKGVDTICVHGDTPNAERVARVVAKFIGIS